MSDSRPAATQAALKQLEDQVFRIREGFERGLDARNTGARMTELMMIEQQRDAIHGARETLSTLVGLIR